MRIVLSSHRTCTSTNYSSRGEVSRNQRSALHSRVTATRLNRPAYRHSTRKRRTLHYPLLVLCVTPTLIALVVLVVVLLLASLRRLLVRPFPFLAYIEALTRPMVDRPPYGTVNISWACPTFRPFTDAN
eukprot:6195668-Pleurochrysis_carterae.AAC.2